MPRPPAPCLFFVFVFPRPPATSEGPGLTLTERSKTLRLGEDVGRGADGGVRRGHVWAQRQVVQQRDVVGEVGLDQQPAPAEAPVDVEGVGELEAVEATDLDEATAPRVPVVALDDVARRSKR